MQDMKRMQIGQVVDYCISYKQRQQEAEKEQKKREKRAGRRRATQADIDAFFG